MILLADGRDRTRDLKRKGPREFGPVLRASGPYSATAYGLIYTVRGTVTFAVRFHRFHFYLIPSTRDRILR